MPNWVYNSLHIDGSKEDMAKLKEEFTKPHPIFSYSESDKWIHIDGTWNMSEGGEYSFRNIVMPNDLEWYHTGENWYHWNIENWGTKWDMSDVDILEDTETSVLLTFSTAWSPPLAVFGALCEKYPNVSFSMSYEEEQGWGGEVDSYGEGQWGITNEYDIPTSHADYEKRENAGNCICAWSSEQEEWFTDCPRVESEVLA